MPKQTPLFDAHRAAGAKLVDFAGWSMPLHYGSQLDEHRAVRARAGMFDVSHMAVADIQGPQARDYLRRLLANDVAKIKPGKALYSCMLNERGGVLDDLIVYCLAGEHYRAVLNAATTAADLDWMRAQASGYAVQVRHRDDLAIVAIQGPKAREAMHRRVDRPLAERASALKPFAVVCAGEWQLGRTGYTGEDGYECIVGHAQALALWRDLAADGVVPCGLGARDTLRLEAGLNLYGQDMDAHTHPYESNLGWTVAWKPEDRDFIGRDALAAVRGASERVLTGVLLAQKGVLRAGQSLRHESAAGEGHLTSGGYAPTLERSVGLARIPRAWLDAGNQVVVTIRGQTRAARLVAPPFVRHGEPKIRIEGTSEGEQT